VDLDCVDEGLDTLHDAGDITERPGLKALALVE
jgi:hypothetical protein